MAANTEILAGVVKKISERYPALFPECRYAQNGREAFVLIDRLDVYESEDYQELIAKIKTEYLWPRDVINVYFGVSDQTRDINDMRIESASHHPYFDFEAYSKELLINKSGSVSQADTLGMAA